MTATSARALLAELQGRQEAMVRLLEELVRAESPSRAPETQDAVLDLLESRLESAGMVVRRVRGHGRSGGLLYARPARRTREAAYQLLIGHADTVWPVGTLATMPVELEGRRLSGPGSYDMKAGLVQALFALEALEALGIRPGVTPVLIVNTDEEIGSRESTRLIERLARGSDRAFVLEPSLGPSGKLKTARKGVGRFTVVVRGRAAHAGLDPESGASAILELAHVVQALFALNDSARGVTVNVGTIDGGLGPNVVAPKSRAVVDVRVPTQEDAERVERAIRAIEPATPGTALEIEGGFGRPPMERTVGNWRLWNLALDAAGELAIELAEATAGGGSDGNTTSLYAPTLDGLGAVGGGAHAPDEFLWVDRMPERAALLGWLVAAPALGPGALHESS